jgi:hypothetical protein
MAYNDPRPERPAHLRFRLEIYTLDGELEYRTEKAMNFPAVLSEEDGV